MSMTTSIPPLTKLAAWQALEAHYPKIRELHLRKLFADDPKRGERMTAEAVGGGNLLLTKDGKIIKNNYGYNKENGIYDRGFFIFYITGSQREYFSSRDRVR